MNPPPPLPDLADSVPTRSRSGPTRPPPSVSESYCCSTFVFSSSLFLFSIPPHFTYLSDANSIFPHSTFRCGDPRNSLCHLAREWQFFRRKDIKEVPVEWGAPFNCCRQSCHMRWWSLGSIHVLRGMAESGGSEDGEDLGAAVVLVLGGLQPVRERERGRLCSDPAGCRAGSAPGVYACLGMIWFCLPPAAAARARRGAREGEILIQELHGIWGIAGIPSFF
ncbi:uncharacterized protein LY79DRAFT_310767 [Colletotrichum navitas]|uniref:Uncharacterized protein n=1 Tax=Colletotrichum navitas TaxID=681940 RepID=A0AAD8PT92_9PEZI|nr:uncharacterized protein LY79DRAFT_310767 [Colletotrichum navitas]KAK1580338.1 hypothetical protein LY79DRAFT_310767 [Colletotrichum navitas]